MHAELCPVCKGEGTVILEKEAAVRVPCHGCDGRGWVTVQDQSTRYPLDSLRERNRRHYGDPVPPPKHHYV